jgi:hypothetical protein
MKNNEYNRPGTCKVHSEPLIHTGDESSNWWECTSCRKEDWKRFRQFLAETSAKWELQPEWKGGGGKGVACPCCKAEGFVRPEVAERIKRFL